jgi:hypothetical protein
MLSSSVEIAAFRPVPHMQYGNPVADHVIEDAVFAYA